MAFLTQVNDSFQNHIYEQGVYMPLTDCDETKKFNREGINEDGERYSVSDAAFGFLHPELSKLIADPFKDITEFQYADDMPMDIGGGLVDFVEWFAVDYRGIFNDASNFFANNGNVVPTVNAAITQKYGKVWTYEMAYDIKFVELEKLSKTRMGKNLEQIFRDIIELGWNKMLQQVAYYGEPMGTIKGLFNNDDATLKKDFGTKKFDASMTNAEIIAAFNDIENYRFESMANTSEVYDRYLVPSDFFATLASRTTDLLSTNLLTYLKKYSLAAINAGHDIVIEPRVQLKGAGTHKAGRIVAYTKNIRRVRMDIPYMLQVFASLPNATTMAYRTLFVGQVGQVIMPYNENDRTAGGVMYSELKNE